MPDEPKKPEAVEPKIDPVAEFQKEYQELCKKHGCMVQITPVWKLTNHGTYELTIESKVVRVSK